MKDPSTSPLDWCYLLLAIVLGNLFNNHLAKQFELSQLNVKVLKRQAKDGTGRPRPTNREKRRMAELAKNIGRKVLMEMDLMFTPDTFMRWYTKLCRAKFDSSKKRKKPGRPKTDEETRQLVLKIARENIRAGYTRICDVMRGLKYEISRSTVANILKEEGVPIAPHRGRPWKDFLKTVWESLAACDMFTVDTPTETYYCLFAIRIATRKVELVGITTNATKEWIANKTRMLTDVFDGFIRDCTHLIHDQEPSFRSGMDPVLKSSGIKPIVIPPYSPNLNPHAERFVGSVRRDCLNHIPIFCEEQLAHVLKQYIEWYNHERPHQGLDGEYIERLDEVGDGPVEVTARLSGLLKHYSRAA